MKKYYFDYSYVDPFSELKEDDAAIIEASSMKEAKALLKLQVEKEVGKIEVYINDAYRTSDDARID